MPDYLAMIKAARAKRRLAMAAEGQAQFGGRNRQWIFWASSPWKVWS